MAKVRSLAFSCKVPPSNQQAEKPGSPLTRLRRTTTSFGCKIKAVDKSTSMTTIKLHMEESCSLHLCWFEKWHPGHASLFAASPEELTTTSNPKDVSCRVVSSRKERVAPALGALLVLAE